MPSLNYWLIPILGIQGAAIATLSSFMLGSILSAIYGRKYYTVPTPYKELFKIIFAVIIMALPLWWLKDYRGWGWLLAQLATGIISYGIMIYILNILDIRAHIKKYIQSR